MTSWTSPRSAHDQPVGRVAEQVVEHLAGLAQLVDGLEQRDEADPRERLAGPADAGAVHVDQAGLAGEQHRGQHVVGAARHRHDVALDDFGTVGVERVADRGEDRERLGAGLVQRRRRTGQRAPRAQLAATAAAAGSRAGRRRRARSPRPAGRRAGRRRGGARRRARARPWSRGAGRTPPPCAGPGRAARRRSARRRARAASAEQRQLGQQLRGAAVVAAGLVRQPLVDAAAGVGDLGLDAGQLEPVRLGGVEGDQRGVDVEDGEVGLDRRGELGRRGDDRGRRRQLGDQRVERAVDRCARRRGAACAGRRG